MRRGAAATPGSQVHVAVRAIRAGLHSRRGSRRETAMEWLRPPWAEKSPTLKNFAEVASLANRETIETRVW
jgi:hypothetical protein